MLAKLTTTSRLSTVWALLLIVTFGSLLIGVEQGAGFANLAAVIIIGVAMFKVHLIGRHFMDVRVAPLALRLIFDGYVVAVFLTLVILDLAVQA